MSEKLIDKIISFENLQSALKSSARGKRKSMGYQSFLFSYGERLKEIQEYIIKHKSYDWAKHRKFYVFDPKKRLIKAAPFQDRVVHKAIYQVLDPIINPILGPRSFACRTSMGNRNAVIRLFNQVKKLGCKRYCIKLDVEKYFDSIDHSILFEAFTKRLPDQSTNKLLSDLINKGSEGGCGVPIGNLTSQLFSNFYLREFDKTACRLLNLPFYEDRKEDHNFYIRYMDDSVIITRSKEECFYVANKLMTFAKDQLKLSIPNEKKVILARKPIPFLGFVLDEHNYRTLRRNERKIRKKLRRMTIANAPLSEKEKVIVSYKAWKNLI